MKNFTHLFRGLFTQLLSLEQAWRLPRRQSRLLSVALLPLVLVLELAWRLARRQSRLLSVALLSLALVLASAQTTEAQNIERVEPPFWWSNMVHSQIELVLYGENLAQYQVSTKELEVVGTRTTENPNYLFITLETQDLGPGSYPINLVKKGRIKKTINYEIRERRAGSASRAGFDASDVIYLIMPDRFANGDPSNDTQPGMNEPANREKPGGRHGGDLRGVIDHVDYLDQLGVTALWSTPLLEDNDAAYSYHGYACSDTYTIDARYGTNAEYVELADSLHRRGMKLIHDYVTNHWGLQHWMIRDLPEYEWIHQFPGYGQTNYRMTTQMDPNASEYDKHWCMDGWFVRTMPDLNHQNPNVMRYLLQNAIWWVEYADLDGFRIDTYSYGDKEAMASWTREILREYPNFSIVGEVWYHDQAQISYWQGGSPIAALQGYDTHLPQVMDFTYHDATMEVFGQTEASWNRGMIHFYENLVNDFLYPRPLGLLTFFENHDTERFNELYPDVKDYKLALTLTATMRGIPQLYYGSEVGMRGQKGRGDADVRRDFPGGWEGDAKDGFTGMGLNAGEREYLSFTQKVLQWRKHSEAVHRGKTLQFIPEHNVYVYFRYTESDTVMVVLNNSLEGQPMQWERYAEMVPKGSIGRHVFEAQEVTAGESWEIPAKSAHIIQWNSNR